MVSKAALRCFCRLLPGRRDWCLPPGLVELDRVHLVGRDMSSGMFRGGCKLIMALENLSIGEWVHTCL